VRQAFYRKLERLERINTVARQAEAHRRASSGAEVMRALLSRYAVERVPGQSRAETLARAAGISTRDLKALLSERGHAGGSGW
jgi:hypothetical protein